MKFLLPVSLVFLSFSPAFAQYEMDLRSVQSQAPHYIQMGNAGPEGKEIKVNNLYMEEGGVPQVPVMGEFHYGRMDHRYWKDALLKMKASGVNIVSTYALWNFHEEHEGRMCWNGQMDLRRFIQLCHEVGLKVHLRFGPYCNAEIRNGGLPDWLKDKKIPLRSNDPLYLAYVQKWYRSVFRQVGDLLYKDGGPIMAIQLENEYVTEGLVVSHIMNLKRIAVAEGFDVPVYSMTHWMASDYPKGEVIPYAGYYIETPWVTNQGKENPVSQFEFFSYNRISDNIGTDIIQRKADVESLEGAAAESPYFTCEVGVGTTSFYNRRAIIPEEMAGENINLRLGCGVNLMGYYMYVGGSNPVGEKTTLQSSGPRIGYDYQAPVREFGTLGGVMKETKKLNYFMNTFGPVLAPARAYLPTSNADTTNLQWAVRTDGNSGFLFVSNYIYKHDRRDYKKVQFDIRLKDNSVKFPRRAVTVRNGAYFLWPFNQSLGQVKLNYATVQPVCSHNAPHLKTYFFFADDGIPAEYALSDKNIREVTLSNGVCKKEKNGYFIDQLIPGKDCFIEITQKNGDRIRLVTLTEEESDYIWNGQVNKEDFVAITTSTLVYDDKQVTVMDETPDQQMYWYNGAEGFQLKSFTAEARPLQSGFRLKAPFATASRITPQEGTYIEKAFDGESTSEIASAVIRMQSDQPVDCVFNGVKVDAFQSMGTYRKADLTKLFKSGKNLIRFEDIQTNQGVIAEMEVLLQNGTRWLWATDGTWIGNRLPALGLSATDTPDRYAPEEHLAVYEVDLPNLDTEEEEVRIYIRFKGDRMDAFIGDQLINDCFYDGSDWILGVSRYRHLLGSTPLTLRVEGFKSATDPVIYFEKSVKQSECLQPEIQMIRTTREYRYPLEK